MALIIIAIAAVMLAPVRAFAQSAGGAAGEAGENDPAVMIVLDGSGSMWGKIGKEQKINAARDALKLTLPKGDSAAVGLTTFGHRRTGDCTDVEVAVPPGKGTQERLAGFLEKLNPKGKGPVGAAVKAAAESLAEKAPRSRRRSLILLADNADNCKVDTCELAQDLKRAQPALTVHVVALGVSKEETAPLACLATTTGGRLLKAEQPSDIAPALEQVVKLVTGAGPVSGPGPGGAPSAAAQGGPVIESAVAKPPTPTVGPPGLQLTAVLSAGGAEITSGVRWRVLADGATGAPAERKVLYEGEDRQPVVDLQPGSYRVETAFGLASAEQVVKVGASGRTQVQVPLNAGIINVKDSSTRGTGSTDRIFYTLYAASGGSAERRALSLSSETLPVYHVPAGTYVVAVQKGLARIERSVVIVAGTVADIDLPLYLGELALSAVATEGGQPIDRIVFQVFEDDPEAQGGLRELVRSSAAQPEFSLPAGSYVVVARHEGAEARERVSLKPGTRLSKALVLASGRLTIASRLPPRYQGTLDPDQLSYRINRLGSSRPVRADAPGRVEIAAGEVARIHAAEQAIALSAGRYVVEGRYGSINVRTQREVEIKPGANQQIVLEMDAGIITLKTSAVAPAPGGARSASDPYAGVYWEIADSTGQVVWSTSQSSPRLALASGKYSARAETRKAKGEGAFVVSSGDERTVEIELK